MAEPPKSSADTKKATNQDDGKLKESNTVESKPDAVAKEAELSGAIKEVSPGNKAKEDEGKMKTTSKSTTEPSMISGGLQCETKQGTGGLKKESSVLAKKAEPGKTQETPPPSVGPALLKPTSTPSTSSAIASVAPATAKANATPSPGASEVLQTKVPSGGGVAINKVPSKDTKPAFSRPTTTNPTAATKSSEGAGNAPSSKKRKHPSTGALSSGTSSAARPTTTATPTLADFPAVAQMVQNMFTLLETYGPLTQAQLEYNLPPLQGERLSQRHFRDVLEVLVATGLLQQEDVTASDVPVSSVQPQQLRQPPQPRYCVLSGVTRQIPTTPINVLQEIRGTQDEWRTSLQRQAKLKAALLNPAIQPREVLKQLLAEFPEIASDPVYVAALRNLHVDVGLVLDNKSGSSRPKCSAKRSRRKPASGSLPKVTNTTLSSTSTTARAATTLPSKAATSPPKSAPAASQPQSTSAMTLVVETKAPASATEGATTTKPTATPSKAGPTPT